jgi:hypothetical protein
MIHANELRLGNWGAGIQWGARMQCNMIVSDWEEVNPIPLTEEWLLKFGFRETNQSIEFRIQTDTGYLTIWTEPKTAWLETFSDYEDSIKIPIVPEYVHQLQNLYFALTGKELELKKYPLDTPPESYTTNSSV